MANNSTPHQLRTTPKSLPQVNKHCLRASPDRLPGRASGPLRELSLGLDDDSAGASGVASTSTGARKSNAGGVSGVDGAGGGTVESGPPLTVRCTVSISRFGLTLVDEDPREVIYLSLQVSRIVRSPSLSPPLDHRAYCLRLGADRMPWNSAGPRRAPHPRGDVHWPRALAAAPPARFSALEPAEQLDHRRSRPGHLGGVGQVPGHARAERLLERCASERRGERECQARPELQTGAPQPL